MITILGKEYKLKEKERVDMLGLMGNISYQEQQIDVDKTLAYDQLEETILHEVLHIISNELKLNLKEDTIARLAVGLYSAGIKVSRKL